MFPIRSRCFSRLEYLARHQSPQGVRSLAAFGVATQEAGGLASEARSSGLAKNFTFCFHDSEEVGRAALAKIGKETGLRPEDL